MWCVSLRRTDLKLLPLVRLPRLGKDKTIQYGTRLKTEEDCVEDRHSIHCQRRKSTRRSLVLDSNWIEYLTGSSPTRSRHTYITGVWLRSATFANSSRCFDFSREVINTVTTAAKIYLKDRKHGRQCPLSPLSSNSCLVQQPNASQGRLILKVPRSHTMTDHSR